MKDRMLQYFSYRHLPQALQPFSRRFGDLADWVVETMPQSPERTVCLRKLLEAKDAGLRTVIYQDPPARTDQVDP